MDPFPSVYFICPPLRPSHPRPHTRTMDFHETRGGIIVLINAFRLFIINITLLSPGVILNCS